MRKETVYLTERGGSYRIRITGVLDPCWSDRLGGLTISSSATVGESDVPVSELNGWLPDQAALYGVLNTLYNNRFELLSVEFLGRSSAPPTPISAE